MNTPIPVPADIRITADALAADIAAVLRPSGGAWTTHEVVAGTDDRPSLDAQIARAKRTLSELQMQWRGVLAAENRRLREDAREGERMQESNARILEGRG